MLNKAYAAMRRQFEYELTWRLYVVSAIAGLLAVVILDVSATDWSILPSITFPFSGMTTTKVCPFAYVGDTDLCPMERIFIERKFAITWSLLQSESYRNGKNLLAIVLLFGPLFMFKSIDWVLAGMRKDGVK